MAKQEITCDDILKELRAKQYRPVYYLMGEEPHCRLYNRQYSDRNGKGVQPDRCLRGRCGYSYRY